MKSTINSINTYLAERTYLVVTAMVVITLIMLYLTLSPAEDLIPSPIWAYDKLGHFLMFGSWSFLLGYYWFLSRPESLNLFVVFLVGVLFGISIEILQSVMPFHRDPDFFDAAYDSLGCFLAVLAIYKIAEK